MKKKYQINIKFRDTDVDKVIVAHLQKQKNLTGYLRKVIMDDILFSGLAEDFRKKAEEEEAEEGRIVEAESAEELPGGEEDGEED